MSVYWSLTNKPIVTNCYIAAVARMQHYEENFYRGRTPVKKKHLKLSAEYMLPNNILSISHSKIEYKTWLLYY